MAKWTVPPAHKCSDNMVSIGDAAKHTGVRYQYIYGLMQRGQIPSRTKYAGSWDTKGKKQVCKVHAEAYYGKAADNKVTGGDLLAEPIQAYRAWVLDDYDGLLHSTTYTYESTWPKTGELHATCSKGHAAPVKRCQCGIYAKSTMNELKQHFNYNHNSVLIFGTVELWGRFIPGDIGWRAEYGKPTALLCDRWEVAELVHHAAEKYGIPVVHSEQALEATNWGQHNYDFGEEDLDGYQGATGTPGGRGDAASSEDADSGAGARASCRTAAAGASSLQELIHLIHEGVISESNILEIVRKG